jgi:hypothetical protein
MAGCNRNCVEKQRPSHMSAGAAPLLQRGECCSFVFAFRFWVQIIIPAYAAIHRSEGPHCHTHRFHKTYISDAKCPTPSHSKKCPAAGRSSPALMAFSVWRASQLQCTGRQCNSRLQADDEYTLKTDVHVMILGCIHLAHILHDHGGSCRTCMCRVLMLHASFHCSAENLSSLGAAFLHPFPCALVCVAIE